MTQYRWGRAFDRPENYGTLERWHQAIIDGNILWNEGKDHPGRVYFALAPRSRMVKIGYTRGNPLARLASLQTGCPEKLFMLGDGVPAYPEFECAIHDKFASIRGVGEWFRLTWELKEFMLDFGEGFEQFACPHMFEEMWGHDLELWDIAIGSLTPGGAA